MNVNDIVWQWFRVVDTLGYIITDIPSAIQLECLRCGSEFIIDTYINFNMMYNAGVWLPQCPMCNQIGEE